MFVISAPDYDLLHLSCCIELCSVVFSCVELCYIELSCAELRWVALSWGELRWGEVKWGEVSGAVLSRVGSGHVGSSRVGSGRVGSGRVGSGRVGSGGESIPPVASARVLHDAAPARRPRDQVRRLSVHLPVHLSVWVWRRLRAASVGTLPRHLRRHATRLHLRWLGPPDNTLSKSVTPLIYYRFDEVFQLSHI